MGILRTLGWMDSGGSEKKLYRQKTLPDAREMKKSFAKSPSASMLASTGACFLGETEEEAGEDSEPEEYFDGPDTSSFAAFLYSLLSFTPQRGNPYDDSSEEDSDEEEREHMKISGKEVGNEGEEGKEGGETMAAYSYRRLSTSWKRFGLGGMYSHQEASSAPPSSTSSPRGKSSIEVPPLDGIRETTAVGAEGPCKAPVTPHSPLKLPDMSEESHLLTEDSRSIIHGALPALAQGREWVLLYSSLKHGISLLTLYRRSELATGPCLLVVGDKSGAVFGGLSSGPLKPSTKKKYQGTSECFVFTDKNGTTQVFKATGGNRYFVLCMNDALAMGGGGHFALQLDGELMRGTSGYCETFQSPSLSNAEDFLVKKVELWGFAHTSRYTPKSATWHEPEVAPGIHTW